MNMKYVVFEEKTVHFLANDDWVNEVQIFLVRLRNWLSPENEQLLKMKEYFFGHYFVWQKIKKQIFVKN